MKKGIIATIIIVIAIVAIVLATSCSEEYLDTDNLYGKSLETFYKTPQDIEESMAGVYNAIYTPNVHSNESIAATLMSDMMLGGGGPDDKSAKYVDNFEDPAEDTYRDMWTQCYSGIARANAIIEKTADLFFYSIEIFVTKYKLIFGVKNAIRFFGGKCVMCSSV